MVSAYNLLLVDYYETANNTRGRRDETFHLLLHLAYCVLDLEVVAASICLDITVPQCFHLTIIALLFVRFPHRPRDCGRI